MRMLRRLNFQSRVLLAFVGILALALCSAATAMYFAANKTGLGLAHQQLLVAQRVVENALEFRDRQLRESTRAVATDFGFREAITSNDAETTRSALENQRARIHADVGLLVSPGGEVLAYTDASLVPLLNSRLLQSAAHERGARPTWPILKVNDRLLQMAVVPVHAPNTVAWLCMGFYLTAEVLQGMKETAGVEISFLAHGKPDAVIAASTLPPSGRSSLTAEVLERMAFGRLHTVTTGGIPYLSMMATLPSTLGSDVVVVLQMAAAIAAEPMADLRRDLFISVGLITALGLIAAMLCARLLARPVQALGDAARSLKLSKRSKHARGAAGDDELAHVADAFHSLLKHAHYDALTGLPNRALLNTRLTEGIQRAQAQNATLAVVFIDLNGFKNINDTLGHDMGDLVLRKTAQRLLRSISSNSTIARLGGDEFVLVLEGMAKADAVREVDRLEAIVRTPMKTQKGTVQVGMSAGIAMYPECARDREALMKCADAAMYQSKVRKRGAVVAKEAAAESGKSRSRKIQPGLTARAEEPDTWTGRFEGKDLVTQKCEVLAITRSGLAAFAAARMPPDELWRLAALRRARLLDSPPLAAVDRVTHMVARTLGVPIVLVSLVDEHRQWFLSRVGLIATETPRDISFCGHVVFAKEMLLVSDAHSDVRFANNPLVKGEPHIRTYAGVPLFSRAGYALGTLCAIDREPRDFGADALGALADYATIVQDLLRAREDKDQQQAARAR